MTLEDLELPAGFAERFWSKVDRSTEGCWEWPGSQNGRGYGKVGWHKRMVPHLMYAHRMAYLLTYGAIPGDLHVCHHCDNRICVRPSHLFAGTSHDNHMDMAAKGRANRQGQHTPRTRKPRLSREEWHARLVRGAQQHKARLDEDRVREIRRRWAAGETQMSLAVLYGVDDATINHIVHRRTWKHVLN